MENMDKCVQFSIFLVNKPGILTQVFRELAKAKVNILNVAMMDTMEHGVLRMVSDDHNTTRQVLKTLNVPVTETDVLSVILPNHTRGRRGSVRKTLDRPHQYRLHVLHQRRTRRQDARRFESARHQEGRQGAGEFQVPAQGHENQAAPPDGETQALTRRMIRPVRQAAQRCDVPSCFVR